MSRKQLLARVLIDSAPWHSIDGWFCNECDRDCGASEDTMCPCCVRNLDAVALENPSGGAV